MVSVNLGNAASNHESELSVQYAAALSKRLSNACSLQGRRSSAILYPESSSDIVMLDYKINGHDIIVET